jgi:hypothetical protein
MPDTLEALFERLRTVEPPAPYAPAHEIRRRGRRQSYRHRLALGGAALAVGGLSAGTAIVAAGGGSGPAPTPVLPTASMSPPPSVLPSPTPSDRPSRPPGGRLVQPSDLGGTGWQPLEGAEVIQNPDRWGSGGLCDYDSAAYPSLPHQTDVDVIAWRSPGATVTEVVEVYEAGWGARNMVDVRSVVAACDAATTTGPGSTRFRVESTDFAGDEAVLVRIEATPFDAPVVVSYLAMVRVGDTVATVGVNLDDPAYARVLAIRAAARLG